MKWILLSTAVLAVAASCGKKPKVLVLYYSQTSTTKVVAEELAARMGAAIEAIQLVEPYDGTYQETIERSAQEKEAGNYPAIEPLKADVSKYDVVFLGYPVWFGTFANPIFTLLDQVDFSGKKVVPFCTFGSGGLESSSKDLAAKLKNSQVMPGYGVRQARIEAAPAEIDRFLKENGYIAGKVEPLPPFSEMQKVTDVDLAIFSGAVRDYPMIQALPVNVASRKIPGGTEYCFKAMSIPRPGVPGGGMQSMTIYVNDMEDGTTDFTRVVR